MEDFLKKESIYYFKSFISNNRLNLFKKINRKSFMEKV